MTRKITVFTAHFLLPEDFNDEDAVLPPVIAVEAGAIRQNTAS